jgi:hypothetical protein
VFEAVASTGYTKSFALLFTHMDHASGDDLRDGKAKKEKVFGGERNVLENQIAKTLSRDAARHLEAQLEGNTFYFAHLDGKFPTKDEAQIKKFEKRLGKQLLEFVVCLAARKQPDLRLPGYPKYSMRSLGLAVREASLAFIESWEAKLGFKYVDGESTAGAAIYERFLVTGASAGAAVLFGVFDDAIQDMERPNGIERGGHRRYPGQRFRLIPAAQSIEWLIPAKG